MLTERLGEAAWLCDALCTGRGEKLAAELDPALDALREIALTLAGQLPAGSPQARHALRMTPLAPGELDGLLARAAELAQRVAAQPRTGDTAAGLAGLFDLANSALTVALRPAGASATPAGVLTRLVDSVLRPLADALAASPRRPAQRAAPARRPPISPISPSCRSASCSGRPRRPPPSCWVRSGAAAEPSRAGRGHRRPAGPGPPARPGGRPGAPAGPAAAAAARAARAGPGGHGRPVPGDQRAADRLPGRAHPGPAPVAPPQLALCRCGGSAIKPLCDGTHARNGFSGAKDPKRVPDRQDSYPGPDVTILDNRGLCQHSGFCSDRLPGVFRAGQEPFVAPGGGRLDEIIHAVRDCPSGALGLHGAGRAGTGRPARPAARHRGDQGRPVPAHRRRHRDVAADGDAGAPQPGRLPGALRAVPVRPVAEQAVLQRHALVRGLPRPGASARPGADPVRVGRGTARADQMDQVAIRKARGR